MDLDEHDRLRGRLACLDRLWETLLETSVGDDVELARVHREKADAIDRYERWAVEHCAELVAEVRRLRGMDGGGPGAGRCGAEPGETP